jgi:3-(3-hydroxy-phenyl)propionate hydroxylase
VRLGPDDYLLDHLGGGFDLLIFTTAAEMSAALREACEAVRSRGVPLRVTAIGAGGPVAGADHFIADVDGQCRQRYGVGAEGGAYLLRPDQHVCARWVTLDGTRLRAAFQAALPH